MSIIQIVILAVIQGLAELLPVSSSAHVIVAEKLMGLDPSTPEMTFFLVMLHTGTMFATVIYFGRRWLRLLSAQFIKSLVIATACTGVLGLTLKAALEHVILPAFAPMVAGGGFSEGVSTAGHAMAGGAVEFEQMFKSLPLIAAALFAAGCVIIYGSRHEAQALSAELTVKRSVWIGLIQGVCLPFRGFSRSGATISAAMVTGLERKLAEEFSFALAVVLTPPVIVHQLRRLQKGGAALTPDSILPGLIGAGFAFMAGLIALKWLSSWLENGKWRYFGYYCIGASLVIAGLAAAGY